MAKRSDQPGAVLIEPERDAGDTRSTPFDGDAAARLRMAIGKLSRRLRPTVAGSGLSPSQISALFTIVRRGPLGLSELAELEALNPTMLSRIIVHLCDLGLIRRESRHLRALAVPNYRRYISGQSVSLIGTWMQMTAQSWLVLTLTTRAPRSGDRRAADAAGPAARPLRRRDRRPRRQAPADDRAAERDGRAGADRSGC
jgi:hypothetical protein